MVGAELTRPDPGRWSRSRRNRIILLHQQGSSRGGGDLPIMFSSLSECEVESNV
jgi:hypothetical protein